MTVHTHFAFKSGHDFILTTLLEGMQLATQIRYKLLFDLGTQKISIYTYTLHAELQKLFCKNCNDNRCPYIKLL